MFNHIKTSLAMELVTSELGVQLFDITQLTDQLLTRNRFLILQHIPGKSCRLVTVLINVVRKHLKAEQRRSELLSNKHSYLWAMSRSSLVKTLASDVIPATLHAMSLKQVKWSTLLHSLGVSGWLCHTDLLLLYSSRGTVAPLETGSSILFL